MKLTCSTAVLSAAQRIKAIFWHLRNVLSTLSVESMPLRIRAVLFHPDASKVYTIKWPILWQSINELVIVNNYSRYLNISKLCTV